MRAPRNRGFFFAQKMSLHIIQSHHNKLFLRYLFPQRWPHYVASHTTTLRYTHYTLSRPTLSYSTKVKPPIPVPSTLAAQSRKINTFVRYESPFACQHGILFLLFCNILAIRILQTPIGMGLSNRNGLYYYFILRNIYIHPKINFIFCTYPQGARSLLFFLGLVLARAFFSLTPSIFENKGILQTFRPRNPHQSSTVKYSYGRNVVE